MTIEILYDTVENEELELFFKTAIGYTVFHNPYFLSYHSLNKFSELKEFTFFSLIFRKGTNIIGFLPGASYIDEKGDKIFKSPFYSSFGGFIVYPEIDFESAENIVETSLDLFKEHGFKNVFIGLTPESYLGQQFFINNYFTYVFLSKGFRLTGTELFVTRPLSENDNFSDLDYSIRKQLKQANNNKLVFMPAEIDQHIYDLLLSNRKKFNAIPTHTFTDLVKINQLFKDTVYVFKTMQGDKLLAGAITIKANGNVLNTFYLFDDESERNLRGMQYTYYKVIEWAADNKFRYVDFGSSTLDLTPGHALIHYKEKFGGKPFLRMVYNKSID